MNAKSKMCNSVGLAFAVRVQKAANNEAATTQVNDDAWTTA